jgi:hypothetical protein
MGEQVRRPLREGEGTKPTTGKPSLREDILWLNAGRKPTALKPQGNPQKPASAPRDQS